MLGLFVAMGYTAEGVVLRLAKATTRLLLKVQASPRREKAKLTSSAWLS
jgi:hypothetical protein